ncbi:molecular chaperone [Enterobacter sp. ENT03]|uniref:fimbrial biogenesis chaperone n=1 Tax=Enterobacter sp. ENT03 TaxID=2854780 RepID=UPI001C43A322|nr:fimbria/pilus periplasmic chaperone [Enterobacter sp. ENT03]MBV7406123.1 fimbria/pilus periplasmic chaperone [Enterobacter sp. ENT03]
MRKFIWLMLAASLLLSAAHFASAGIIIGGTRVLYQGNKKEASLSVRNPDNITYLIQSWVDRDNADTKAKFIITPPLFRLDAGQQNVMRIVSIAALPQDKESLFWLNIKTIPSAAPKENTLQIAVKTRMKLIYRPDSLVGNMPEDQVEKLQWSRTGNTLQVINPTAYYMHFNEISLNGKTVGEAGFVAPGGSEKFTLPPDATGRALTFKVINDYGGVGSAHHASL